MLITIQKLKKRTYFSVFLISAGFFVAPLSTHALEISPPAIFEKFNPWTGHLQGGLTYTGWNMINLTGTDWVSITLSITGDLTLDYTGDLPIDSTTSGSLDVSRGATITLLGNVIPSGNAAGGSNTIDFFAPGGNSIYYEVIQSGDPGTMKIRDLINITPQRTSRL